MRGVCGTRSWITFSRVCMSLFLSPSAPPLSILFPYSMFVCPCRSLRTTGTVPVPFRRSTPLASKTICRQYRYSSVPALIMSKDGTQARFASTRLHPRTLVDTEAAASAVDAE